MKTNERLQCDTPEWLEVICDICGVYTYVRPEIEILPQTEPKR